MIEFSLVVVECLAIRVHFRQLVHFRGSRAAFRPCFLRGVLVSGVRLLLLNAFIAYNILLEYVGRWI